MAIFRMNWKVLCLMGIFLASLQPVNAYIDPGTAGMILQSGSGWLVAIFAAITAFLGKIFYHPIKKVILKIARRK